MLSEELMRTVKIDHLQKAINGDSKALINAFIWDDHYMGHDYWGNIFFTGAPITDEVSFFLREILTEYNARQKTSEQPGIQD